MELKRTAFQGIGNIIRFNWHFYAVAALLIVLGIFLCPMLPNAFGTVITIFILMLSVQTMVSLMVSYFIYDRSTLYNLDWFGVEKDKKIMNINAGFDETSCIITTKYPRNDLTICDFYNENQHTEISLKRARKLYPPVENTIEVSTRKLSFADNSYDTILLILSAHEIRNELERNQFFLELNRILQPNGKIYVVEHLRDLNNFIAYFLGFFHFHSRSTWLNTFQKSGLILETETKMTPFISIFKLHRR